MNEAEKLLKEVEILRDKLLYLIAGKEDNLTDPEVVIASKILNAALNKYNEFIEGKIKGNR